MHIVFITPEYEQKNKPLGGLAQYVAKTSAMLTEQGHVVTVITRDIKVSQYSDGQVKVFTTKSNAPAALILKIPFAHDFYVLCSNLKFAIKSKRLLGKINNNNKVDIVQTSSFCYPGIFVCKKYKHICRISSYTPLLRHIDNQKKGVIERASDWFELYTVKKADAVISPSKLMAKVYRNYIKNPISIVPTVLPQINQKELQNNFYNKNLQGKKYLLFFGRFSRVKGTDLIADIIPKLLDKYDQINLAFIGSDTNYNRSVSFKQHLIDVSYKHGNRVLVSPPLPKSELFTVIKNAYAVLMPSRIDNLPNAALETLALETPIVGSYESSIEELVANGKTGFLAKNGSTEDLLKQIDNLLNLNKEEYLKMKVKINNYVTKYRTLNSLQKLLEVYYKYAS